MERHACVMAGRSPTGFSLMRQQGWAIWFDSFLIRFEKRTESHDSFLIRFDLIRFGSEIFALWFDSIRFLENGGDSIRFRFESNRMLRFWSDLIRFGSEFFALWLDSIRFLENGGDSIWSDLDHWPLIGTSGNENLNSVWLICAEYGFVIYRAWNSLSGDFYKIIQSR